MPLEEAVEGFYDLDGPGEGRPGAFTSFLGSRFAEQRPLLVEAPFELRVGDGLDFWRVVALEPPHRLLLLAEMKAPGDALLEIRIKPEGERRVGLEMVARFLQQILTGLTLAHPERQHPLQEP